VASIARQSSFFVHPWYFESNYFFGLPKFLTASLAHHLGFEGALCTVETLAASRQ
jgi:hypothetical protein